MFFKQKSSPKGDIKWQKLQVVSLIYENYWVHSQFVLGGC